MSSLSGVRPPTSHTVANSQRFAQGITRRLVLGLVSFFLFLSTTSIAAVSSAPDRTVSEPAPEAFIKFWNRVIAAQREPLAGASPAERAVRATKRLANIPINASPDEVVMRSLKVEEQDGVGFLFRDHLLFFLAQRDLDRESGETLEQASASALRNLKEALQARIEERSWPIVRTGLLYTFVGLILLVAFCAAAWKTQHLIVTFLRSRIGSRSLTLFGIDLLPHIVATVHGLVRTFAWLLTISFTYLWVTLSLRRFPYTAPLAAQAGDYVLNSIRELGETIVHELPGLFVVIVIFLLTRWLVRMANAVFDQVVRGKIALSWMDADVARATQRIFSAILWIFAMVVAYPYIPGSRTEAFKGLSVLLGVVISLGSTGIINQIMSGLVVVYARALKTGEWIRVSDTEGEVLEMGLLAAKIRTMEGREVTVPNSVLVSTSATNFTRLGRAEGMTISATVTIGYGTPWRQVHGLLELAADRTVNIRKQPKPMVLQKQLSDFYVEYMLVAQLEEEKSRIETVSNLNSAIQDAFNEFGVQIMSPHYMLQPTAKLVVPPDQWHTPPATPDGNSSTSHEEIGPTVPGE